MMDRIFRDILGIFVVVYLDDILIFSENTNDHYTHVEEVLKRLRQHKLYCKPEKCSFFTDKLSYLGFVISPSGISMDPKKVSAVMEWAPPIDVTGVQSFLGFANFYRQFIPNFSQIVTPLTNLTRKDVKFEWSASCQLAFDTLKQAFSSDVLLLHPDTQKPFIVETDASDFAVSGVLSQYDSQDVLRPIAFYGCRGT